MSSGVQRTTRGMTPRPTESGRGGRDHQKKVGGARHQARNCVARTTGQPTARTAPTLAETRAALSQKTGHNGRIYVLGPDGGRRVKAFVDGQVAQGLPGWTQAESRVILELHGMLQQPWARLSRAQKDAIRTRWRDLNTIIDSKRQTAAPSTVPSVAPQAVPIGNPVPTPWQPSFQPQPYQPQFAPHPLGVQQPSAPSIPTGMPLHQAPQPYPYPQFGYQPMIPVGPYSPWPGQPTWNAPGMVTAY